MAYTVAKGDTLSAIAQKNNTTVDALAKLNGITNPNLIKVGQTLNLTGNSVVPAKPTAPTPAPVSTPTPAVPSSTPYVAPTPSPSNYYSMGGVNLNTGVSTPTNNPTNTPVVPTMTNTNNPATSTPNISVGNTNNTPNVGGSMNMGSVNINTGFSTPGANLPVTPTGIPNDPNVQPNSPATNPITSTNPNSTSIGSNALLQKLLDSMTPSTQETDLQTQLANLEASRKLSYQDLENQPIATPFITGQEAAVDKSVNNKQQTVQGQLSVLQNKRGLIADAAKAALEFTKPTTVGLGTNLVNPITGETIAVGQSYQEKLGASNVLSLSKTYPDAGILPSDSPDVAAQKASNAPSFIAKYGKASYQWNPATGQFDFLTTNRLGTTNPSSSYNGNPNGNGSTGSSNFGVSGSSPSGAGTGTPLDVGAQGDAVSALQNFLISKGYSIPSGATGYYGAQTQAAVAQFQRDSGVDTSQGGVGTFGPKTQAAARQSGFNGGGGSVGSAQGSTQGSTQGGGSNSGGSSNFVSGGTVEDPISKLSAQDQIYATTGDPNAAKLYPAQIGPAAQRIQAAIPGWTPVNAKAQAKFYESPKTQTFIANSNTVLDTINQIKQLSNQVNRGNLTVLNNGRIALNSATSDPNTTKLVQLSGILSDEIGKILGSGQGSDFTIQLGQSLVNPSYSQEAFNANMDQLSGRVKNKVNEYMKQGGQQAAESDSTSSSSSNSAANDPNSPDYYNYDRDVAAAQDAIAKGADPAVVAQRFNQKYAGNTKF